MPIHSEKYMAHAIQLATLGAQRVAPNPMVGAVLVHEDRLLSEGYHSAYGLAHAEVACINAVKKEDEVLLTKATLYVTLEPCHHYGKTPPCTDLIIKKGIPHVVVGCIDQNPIVAGKGIQRLKEHGVQVSFSALEKECLALNKKFNTFHIKKRPYIILKYAESADGFISQKNKSSKITNAITDRWSHKNRSEVMGIWAGYNTYAIDNPKLDCRLYDETIKPFNIVFDTDATLSTELYFFQKPHPFQFYFHKNKKKKEGIFVDIENEIEFIIQYLYKQQVQSVLIEGGTALLEKCIAQNKYDEIIRIQSPIRLGDGIKSPKLNPDIVLKKSFSILDDTIHIFENPSSL
ncbi:MAG: bifunctional diaminohydroxyphosphoribosylaminopyrimidine deaminase/5-amino-6-(5-phosphoribosylamino)uracil reductase RibD [Chitinophagaceae bacterium]